MKDLDTVASENKEAYVYTLADFISDVDYGVISQDDGFGFFHDGEHRTTSSVWNNDLTWDDVKDYPYVLWFNR